jgi:hypothetical protein
VDFRAPVRLFIQIVIAPSCHRFAHNPALVQHFFQNKGRELGAKRHLKLRKIFSTGFYLATDREMCES